MGYIAYADDITLLTPTRYGIKVRFTVRYAKNMQTNTVLNVTVKRVDIRFLEVTIKPTTGLSVLRKASVSAWRQ